MALFDGFLCQDYLGGTYMKKTTLVRGSCWDEVRAWIENGVVDED